MNSSKNPTLPGCREGWPLVLLLYALLAGSYCFGQERQTSGAVEIFAPVFDIGVVYQPKPGEYGITELMNAALAGDAQRVDDLIQTGADVDAVDDGGATALIRAAAYDYIDIVNLLLAANADPQPISNDGRSALSVAVEYKSSDVALALIGHGANPDTYLNSNRPEYRRSVLEHAAVTGQTSVVLALIENGADLSVNGPKALNAALWQGHSEIAAALINSRLDINAKFADPNKPANLQTGRVALQTAAQGGERNSVQEFAHTSRRLPQSREGLLQRSGSRLQFDEQRSFLTVAITWKPRTCAINAASKGSRSQLSMPCSRSCAFGTTW